MTAPHLIGIGRLGGRDSDGWHHVMIKPEYKEGFNHIEELYLIFEENRVFYVTICDKKLRDKKMWVRFAEDGIAEERKLHKEAILALEDDSEESGDETLLGQDAVYKGNLLGCVVDVFFNGAQDVLVIATDLEIELMVPFVDHYLEDEGMQSDVIFLRNMEDLLAANGMTIRDGLLLINQDEN